MANVIAPIPPAGHHPATHPGRGAGAAVRRLVVFVLLFVLVCLAATGVAGIITRIVGAGVSLTDDSTSGLATSLAFTLIAGPLAALLWWFAWRRLGERPERDSPLWGLYLAGMSTVALVLAVTAILTTLASLISGEWNADAVGTGVAWAGIWAWHAWMSRDRSKAPTRLTGGSRILGYVFGTAVGASAMIAFVTQLVDLAVEPAVASSAGSVWFIPLLQSAVWVVGGALVWWGHWTLQGASALRTGFATVTLALVTGLGAVGLTLVGLATSMFVALRLVTEDGARDGILDPLGSALGAAAVGAIIWAYYRAAVRSSTSAAQLGARLVGAGVALGAAATGLGIVVNSILAGIVAPLAESDEKSLLFAGLSALVVGGVAWWLIWRPLAPISADSAGETGRRVYLIAVFGISALVAIITLIVIGFQIFDFALGGADDGSLLERVRAALGLFTATVFVAGYHFSVWRHDRSLLPPAEAVVQTIARVTLVSAADGEATARAIRGATGAAVTVWTSAADGAAASPEDVVAALDGVSAGRVLVIADLDGVRVIPLRD